MISSGSVAMPLSTTGRRRWLHAAATRATLNAMAAKKAPTAAKPKKVSYLETVSAPDGAIYSAQSPAGRSDHASLIVRYASAEALDAPGEIVHGHRAKFHDLAVAADGACHAVSKDGSWHSNESGSWRTDRITKGGLYAVGTVGASTFAGGDGGTLFVRRGGAWTAETTAVAEEIRFLSSFAGVSENDVYAAGSAGLLHYDGTRWNVLAHEDEDVQKSVVVVSADEVYVASFSGLFRGSARTGFTKVADRSLQYATIHAGAVLTCAYRDGVFRWSNGALTRVGTDDFSFTGLDGGGKYLCGNAGMQDGILLFDGESWAKKTPR